MWWSRAPRARAQRRVRAWGSSGQVFERCRPPLRYAGRVTVRFALPSSLGAARAQARGELIKTALESLLNEPVRIEVASDYGSLVGLARASAADLVWAPSVVCARLEDEAAVVMKAVREGRTTYRSALVARRDSGITLHTLRGKRAAWVDRTSLAGHLLVAQHLRSFGLEPSALFAAQTFVGSYPDALKAVLDGHVDVAAIFVPDSRPEVIDRALGLLVGPARAIKLSTLLVTDAAPTDAVVVTTALPEAERTAVSERLFPSTELRPRPTAFCLAMEVDAFERSKPGEYQKLRDLWTE